MVDKDFRRLPHAIQLAIQQIRQHPHVDDICLDQAKLERQYYHVIVSIRTNLPNQWLPKGESPNGIKVIEAIDFHFPETYPTNPPKIQLRNDFDRRLPHIHPGRDGDPVKPCYYDGDTRELLHQCGILIVVNQIVDWLEKAATGKLIDYRQGWEPIRRDSVKDIVIADLDAIWGLVKNRENHAFLQLNYQRIVKPHAVIANQLESYLLATIGAEPIRITAHDIGRGRLIQETALEGSAYSLGQSVGLMVYSGKSNICNQYEPDTVQTLAQLVERASVYGCETALINALRHLQEQTSTFESVSIPTPILIFLCVRRPVNIIGSNSSIEVIAYKIEDVLPLFSQPWDNIKVWPASLLYAITSPLLRQLSGFTKTQKDLQNIVLGGGSLGSKIALHLARAGNAPTSVIDNKFLSPHNAARHGLIGIDFIEKKVDALSHAIKSLGQKTIAIDKDVTSIASSDKALRECIPKKTDLVINTTASLAVRNVLSAIPRKKMPSRVVESCLFAHGTVGVMSLEGEQRNPNTSDLMLEVYNYASHNESLRMKIFSDNPLTRQATGQGCGSMTMQMPDTDISLFAAAMSNQLLNFETNGIPQDAQFCIGEQVNNGMGLNWVMSNVQPYLIIKADNEANWNIRISTRAQNKINQECENYPNVETGGILVGAVSEARQAVTVVDVLPAPSDSKRSTTEFVLGTAGIKAKLKDYAKQSNYSLMCIGTWHSHLSDTGASQRDYQTASVIANSVPIVSALLIKTPKRYRAVIAKRVI